MVFVTGPRQIGKTFLAKQIMQEYQNPEYLNYDVIEDRRIIHNRFVKQANLLPAGIII
ncbi:MAG: AAA family ATPase [bacterium]